MNSKRSSFNNNCQISKSNTDDNNYNEIYNIFIQIIQDILSHQEESTSKGGYK